MLPIQKMLTKYNFSPRSELPKFLVIHDVGEVSNALDNAKYFGGGNREASADFFVDSTNIIQIIDYTKDYAWSIGDGNGSSGIVNPNSMSVEMCLESNHQPSEATIQNTLDLTHYLMNELNIPFDKVVTHHICTGKICPGSFSANNWAKWADFKARMIIPNVKPVVNTSNLQIQQMLNKLGYKGENGLALTEDGDLGANSIFAIKAFQKHDKLTVDGIVGGVTLAALKSDIAKLVAPVVPIIKPIVPVTPIVPVKPVVVTPVVVTPIVVKPVVPVVPQTVPDANVRVLQNLCNELGIKDSSDHLLACDGLSGVNTKYSVSHLPLCGISYHEAIATKYIQSRLSIVSDGVFGIQTEAVLKVWQKNHSLVLDGVCGGNTWLSFL